MKAMEGREVFSAEQLAPQEWLEPPQAEQPAPDPVPKPTGAAASDPGAIMQQLQQLQMQQMQHFQMQQLQQMQQQMAAAAPLAPPIPIPPAAPPPLVAAPVAGQQQFPPVAPIAPLILPPLPVIESSDGLRTAAKSGSAVKHETHADADENCTIVGGCLRFPSNAKQPSDEDNERGGSGSGSAPSRRRLKDKSDAANYDVPRPKKKPRKE